MNNINHEITTEKPRINNIKQFKYTYKMDKGPLGRNQLTQPIIEGNCRLAVQLYFFFQHHIYIKPEDVLCPKFYNKTGRFVNISQEDKNIFNKLRPGDIIFAEKIKNRSGVQVSKKR